MNNIRKIVVDPFCFKQFDKSKNSSSTIDSSIEEFERIVNQQYQSQNLVNGYASFCKHLFLENWTNTINPIVEITNQNEHHLRTEYEARTEKELPVLVRYFPSDKLQNIDKAKFLDIILYSKEQIQLENAAMGNSDPNYNIPYEYGIVAIKPQPINYEIPMNPITMMRNALGKSEGGSGVPLEREKYNQSVLFWSKHALLK